MAIYAPDGSYKKVASLVSANPQNGQTSTNDARSINIDGTTYKINEAKVNDLAGIDGTVPFLGRSNTTTDEGYTSEEIFRQDVFVCENEDDFEKSKNSQITMNQVFNSWTKGGYLNGAWYGYDANYIKATKRYENNIKAGTIPMWFEWNKKDNKKPTSFSQLENSTEDEMKSWRYPETDLTNLKAALFGYPFWYYSTSISSIIQGCNTVDSSFYLSPFKMKQYDITVKCKSYNDDDDCIGLIVASAINSSNNRPRLLSFIRTSNNSNADDGVMPITHAYFKVNAAWSNYHTANEKYNIQDLSAKYFSTRGVYQARFTELSSSGTHIPKMNEDGTFERQNINYYTIWNNNPTAYEISKQSSLYQVKYPTDYNSYLKKTNWDKKTTKIDINNLSAPENWWWMNNDQWNNFKTVHNFGWHNAGYSYIRIRRDGNMISVWTTKFTGKPDNTTLTALGGDIAGVTKCPTDWNTAVANKDAYMLTLDLNSTDDKIENIPLKTWSIDSEPNGGYIGFITQSQAGATWEIIDMQIPRYFVKVKTNELIEYNPLTKEYKTITDQLPQDFCGRGRLCKNMITKKTFYVGNAHFEKISEIR